MLCLFAASGTSEPSTGRLRKPKSAAQLRPWKSDEVQGIVDAVLRGDDYSWIERNLTGNFLGKPLRTAVELREVLQMDGAAYDFFPGLPIYWDFSIKVAETGATQPDQDTSELTDDEVDELILFHCREMTGVDPSMFKIKRSSAFLTVKLAELAGIDPMFLTVAARNIEEKRALRARLGGPEASTSSPGLVQPARYSNNVAMAYARGQNVYAQAPQGRDPEETENEGAIDRHHAARVSAYNTSPDFAGSHYWTSAPAPHGQYSDGTLSERDTDARAGLGGSQFTPINVYDPDETMSESMDTTFDGEESIATMRDLSISETTVDRSLIQRELDSMDRELLRAAGSETPRPEVALNHDPGVDMLKNLGLWEDNMVQNHQDAAEHEDDGGWEMSGFQGPDDDAAGHQIGGLLAGKSQGQSGAAGHEDSGGQASGAEGQHDITGWNAVGLQPLGFHDLYGATGDETSDDEIDDPPVVHSSQPPGPDHGLHLANRVTEFRQRWAQRPPSGLSPEREDRSFIKHARRWGMSDKAISESGVLQTGRIDVRGVNYRIHQMLRKGKDVYPRTLGYAWHRYQAAQRVPNTPKAVEVHRFKAAILQGWTVQQIVDSGIVTEGINTVQEVRHRWDSYRWRGYNFPPPK
ncbi:MAG: hypothetical protein Q9218_006117 [Villophora microphyllina]